MFVKPSPILSHMPSHVLDSIVNDLDNVSKLSLRQCSYNFKEIIDKSPAHLPYVFVELKKYSIQIGASLDDKTPRNVEFHQGNKVTIVKNTRLNTQRTIKGRDFMEMAAEKLCRVFKNPKVSIDLLRFVMTPQSQSDHGYKARISKFLDHLEIALDSLKHGKQLKVTSFSMVSYGSEEDLLKILPRFRPGVLETLKLGNRDLHQENRHFTKITELEQWKKAKKISADNTLHWPLHTLANFQEARTVTEEIKLEHVQGAVEMFLKNPQMQLLEVTGRIHSDHEEIEEYIQKFQHCDGYGRIETPGTKGFLKLYLEDDCMAVQRCQG